MFQPQLVMDELLCQFANLEDPRSEVNRKHPLLGVIMIAIIGILASPGGPNGIVMRARVTGRGRAPISSRRWHLSQTEFRAGTSSCDCFVPVKPEAFQKLFRHLAGNAAFVHGGCSRDRSAHLRGRRQDTAPQS